MSCVLRDQSVCFQPQQEEQQPEELMFEEDSVLGEEEEEEEQEEGSRNKVLVELELLVCKTRQMLGSMMTTGRKVLLTALLGITGKLETDR